MADIFKQKIQETADLLWIIEWVRSNDGTTMKWSGEDERIFHNPFDESFRLGFPVVHQIVNAS